jgi:hypothetical protein
MLTIADSLPCARAARSSIIERDHGVPSTIADESAAVMPIMVKRRSSAAIRGRIAVS